MNNTHSYIFKGVVFTNCDGGDEVNIIFSQFHFSYSVALVCLAFKHLHINLSHLIAFSLLDIAYSPWNTFLGYSHEFTRFNGPFRMFYKQTDKPRLGDVLRQCSIDNVRPRSESYNE